VSQGFAADWLALREPADRAARDCHRLVDRLRLEPPIEVLDLGAGSGANLRYLAPKLRGEQHWTLIDQDAALLRLAKSPNRTVEIETRLLDLAHDFESFDLPQGALVAASALMDLVSGLWFDRLAARCRDARATLLLALNYDGRITWQPPDPHDATVRDLVNLHQRRDKGFGSALGPEASAHMAKTLIGLGYEVQQARSDWQLGPDDAALQSATLTGLAEAACEQEPGATVDTRTWQTRRETMIRAGASRLRVGHRDLLATPG